MDLATSALIDRAVPLARAFHAYGVWSHAPFDEAAVREMFAALATGDNGYLHATDTGLIGGVLVPLWFSPGVVTAAELFWYSQSPGEGRALRQGFEAWARESGAHHIQFSAMADAKEPTLRRLFARAGYELCELGFRRVA